MTFARYATIFSAPAFSTNYLRIKKACKGTKKQPKSNIRAVEMIHTAQKESRTLKTGQDTKPNINGLINTSYREAQRKNQINKTKRRGRSINTATNKMKKIFLCIVSAALIVAGGMFLQSCESETDKIGIEEFAASLTPICISEIPEGVVPMEFRNMREAKAFFEKLKREREKNPITVYTVSFEEQEQLQLSPAPRLRSATFEYGQSRTFCLCPLFGSVYLRVNIGYNYVGGKITVTSDTSGWTLGWTWNQTFATARWGSNNSITWEVIGTETFFIGIGGVGFNAFSMTHNVGGITFHR